MREFWRVVGAATVRAPVTCTLLCAVSVPWSVVLLATLREFWRVVGAATVRAPVTCTLLCAVSVPWTVAVLVTESTPRLAFEAASRPESWALLPDSCELVIEVDTSPAAPVRAREAAVTSVKEAWLADRGPSTCRLERSVVGPATVTAFEKVALLATSRGARKSALLVTVMEAADMLTNPVEPLNTVPPVEEIVPSMTALPVRRREANVALERPTMGPVISTFDLKYAVSLNVAALSTARVAWIAALLLT